MIRTIVPTVVLMAGCPTTPPDTSGTAPSAVSTVETVWDSPPTAVVAEVAPAADLVVPVAGSPPVAAVPMASYKLRQGETLAHFARWSGVPVEDIAQASGLSLSGSYAVGTAVIVPVDVEKAALIDVAREAHGSARVDAYLASRGGSVGVEEHSVRTGETAWTIARTENGIPVWMLEAYNPAVDLDRLKPGQTLLVPVLADVVVDAE